MSSMRLFLFRHSSPLCKPRKRAVSASKEHRCLSFPAEEEPAKHVRAVLTLHQAAARLARA